MIYKIVEVSTEVQRDYEFVADTFVSRHKEPEVEVGDALQADFHPQLKLKRWGNEVNLSLRLLDPTPGKAVLATEGDRIIWRKGQMEARFYAEGWGVDEGAFEFEVVFNQRPPTNRLEFSIQSKELTFSYQPPLTQQELDEGVERPDNVVGSYAVYHATKENIHPSQAEAEKYKVGKAFHIYRPKARDSAGHEVWADLAIDVKLGTLTVTLDQAWLDAAVYPVTVDPDFGFSTQGVSTYTVAANRVYGGIFPSGGNGTATLLGLFCKQRVGYTPTLHYIIYDEGGATYPTDRVGYTDEWTLTGGWDGEKTLNIAAGGAIENTDYWLVVAFDADITIYGDTTTGTRIWKSETYAYPFPDPFPATGTTSSPQRYSIYCAYEAAGVTTRRYGLTVLGVG